MVFFQITPVEKLEAKLKPFESAIIKVPEDRIHSADEVLERLRTGVYHTSFR